MSAAQRFEASDLQDLVDTEAAGARGLIAWLIEDFSAHVETHLHDIENAQKRCDANELKRQAHSLKASTRALGLRAASELCREIETLARAGGFDPRFSQALRAEIPLALAELNKFLNDPKKS